MAPHRETAVGAYANNVNQQSIKNKPQPPRLSMESLQRTLSESDITSELSKEAIITTPQDLDNSQLPPISETEDANCECCGMSEECSQEYITRVRNTYSGKLICGLCAEAVRGEMEKNGGKSEEALKEHMSACARFNRIGRAYPVLCQAQAMREILKKSRSGRAKSMSPRDKSRSGAQKKGVIMRSSSCISTISREI